MAANGKRRKPDWLRELRLKVAVEHPGWSDGRIQAELIRAQLGAGDYAKIRARSRRPRTVPQREASEVLVMRDREYRPIEIETLGDICYEKAEHVASNWGDRILAREWEQDGKRLHRLEAQVNLHW